MPDQQQAQPVLRCAKLAKFYRQGDARIDVLKGVELSVYAGQRIAIVGTSGSGKSTLLSLLGALDSPSDGYIELAGLNPQTLDDRSLSRLRNAQLGFVYQFHHLLPEFSALENVAMPLMIAGDKRKAANATALALLERVGLGNRQTHLPAELSGGERQRVAIARALVNSPGCVLMDEPTGNLDSDSAATIQQLIGELSRERATAFIVVTHDSHVAGMM
ncbi:MAG: ATP-binding cassette domain-containing protein, partial [Pseudomonadales bacterium]|nr:ATP-binding cassette domain-containing protein [Gammaproteobacteria bacterium]NNL56402.1 ATP-binding cassette domain-containing protein [Pseudomonadales bacterium]